MIHEVDLNDLRVLYRRDLKLIVTPTRFKLKFSSNTEWNRILEFKLRLKSRTGYRNLEF